MVVVSRKKEEDETRCRRDNVAGEIERPCVYEGIDHLKRTDLGAAGRETGHIQSQRDGSQNEAQHGEEAHRCNCGLLRRR